MHLDVLDSWNVGVEPGTVEANIGHTPLLTFTATRHGLEPRGSDFCEGRTSESRWIGKRPGRALDDS